MSDEKTRPAQRAVRRKPAITDLATRKVAAVKRRHAPPPGVEAHLVEPFRVRDELIVKARRLTIAHATRVMSGGIISTFSHLEVALEKSATPFERLCLVSALVLSDAWALQYPPDGRDDDFV